MKNKDLYRIILGLSSLLVLLTMFLVLPSLPSKQNGVGSALQTCARETFGQKETCYSKALEQISYNKGPVYAFETLAALQKKDRDAIGCHFIAHGIGYGAYKRAPADWQKSFRAIDASCSYGAMHGILEMRLLYAPESLKKESIPNICGASPRGDCNHIVGHLALLLAENDIGKALNTCRGLPVGIQQFYCFSGVFMENITALNLIKHGFADETYLNWAARVPEMEKLCLAKRGEEARACWEEIAHALAVKFKNSPRELYAFCERAPERIFTAGCKRHSVGIMAASLQFDFSKIGSLCEAGKEDPEFVKECSSQLVASALATLPDKDKEAVNFCASLEAGAAGKCFTMIGNSLPSARKTKACGGAPAKYKEGCLRGGAEAPTLTPLIRHAEEI